MQSLWSLAHNGRTIVSTIHQPRSSIYGMFDQLLLLSEGLVMYYGDADQAVSIVCVGSSGTSVQLLLLSGLPAHEQDIRCYAPLKLVLGYRF